MVKNYIYIVSKIKKEIKKEINDDKKDWIKNELDIILASLNKKLERKVLKDVETDLEESFDKFDLGVLKIYNNIVVKDNLHHEKKVRKLKVEDLVKDCLGLLKCLKVEGDVDMAENRFYLRTLKRISEVFPENEVTPKMHNFSNTLIEIIEKFKNTSK